MKIILPGYSGSQKIVPITRHLFDKYLKGHRVIFINYEDRDTAQWSNYMADYLETIDDDIVIFGLDDYLPAEKMDDIRFGEALSKLKEVSSVRLCESMVSGIQEEYSVTTQLCLWNKDKLIEVLRQTSDPWDFEINGTRYYDSKGYKTYGFIRPIIRYSDCSALSLRHPGKINVLELNNEDIKLVLKYYNKEDLILGQKRGEPVLWMNGS
jgi:hypothetical protein